jgi:glycosyltransferase involved in cell wall biosynthesis
MNKVLIITYYWPPGSGAGVQRWLKFSKYLPEFGWEPIILTVDPEYAAYPATDRTLEKDIPAGTGIYKTKATNYFRVYSKNKTAVPSAGFASGDDESLKAKLMRFIRGNFFIPDPRKGWNRFAFRKACEIIETEGIKHIITTSPPHSTQLIGLKLKRKYAGIRWISDLRDPWTDIYYYDQFYHTTLARNIDRSYEKKVLRNADHLITVGKSLKELFVSKVNEVSKKIDVLTNGYDEDDFKGIDLIIPDKFTISYIGTLSESYPLDGFTEAMKIFKDNGNDFVLRFVGTVSPKQKEAIISKVGTSNAEFIPYVNHGDAINYMISSSVVLLIIPDHHSNGSIITGKLFEYLASGKPILCLGPVDGDAATIINDSEAGVTIHYNDIEKMILNLEYLSTENSGKRILSNISYSRNELTRRLATILTDL